MHGVGDCTDLITQQTIFVDTSRKSVHVYCNRLMCMPSGDLGCSLRGVRGVRGVRATAPPAPAAAPALAPPATCTAPACAPHWRDLAMRLSFHSSTEGPLTLRATPCISESAEDDHAVPHAVPPHA